MDVNQCIDAQRVLNRRMNEIRSLGLQKLVVIVAAGVFVVPFPSLTLLVIMVVVFHIVTIIQE
jgi:hypothetical protein